MFKVVLPFISTFPTKVFKKFAREESGADLLEYVLVLTLVTLACVAGLTKLGNSVSSALNTVANTVTNGL